MGPVTKENKKIVLPSQFSNIESENASLKNIDASFVRHI